MEHSMEQALRERDEAIKAAQQAYAEAYFVNLYNHIIEKHGTTDPPLAELTPESRHRHVGFNEKGAPVTVAMPYFTCTCKTWYEKVPIPEYNKRFKVNYKAEEGQTTITVEHRPPHVPHSTDCPFHLFTEDLRPQTKR